jgi:hypothetical protein
MRMDFLGQERLAALGAHDEGGEHLPALAMLKQQGPPAFDARCRAAAPVADTLARLIHDFRGMTTGTFRGCARARAAAAGFFAADRI